MYRDDLLNNLDGVERVAKASKFGRLLANPIKYVRAIGFKKFIYNKDGKGLDLTAPVFFGGEMHLQLPSSTDIYLTGGKSHDSEIRLAKFIIKNLRPGDSFVDVGAHYGYFTLLAAELVGEKGSVVSFEAAPKNFSILQKNATDLTNVQIRNKAVSDQAGEITFYQFPNLYSEYNSIDASQFENEEWFQKVNPEKVTAQTVALQEVFAAESINPQIIKIDVEGAEYQVILGLKNYLKSNATYIVMEYLNASRGNAAHAQAADLLFSLGYQAHIIDRHGALQACPDIDAYMANEQIDSDNFVFYKSP